MTVLQPMYPGMVNSPATELAEAITDTQTTAAVANGAKLPAAPNIAVLGTDEDCETIFYGTKVGNNLGSITRAYQGNAKRWEAGTQVSRRYTDADHAAFIANITALNEGKAEKSVVDEHLAAKANHVGSVLYCYRNLGGGL